MNFLNGITILLVCQLAGEFVSRYFQIAVPGPVLGMLLLLSILFVKGRVPTPIQNASVSILQHLSLLFVPAGVGMMLYFDRIKDEWLAILLALVLSTVITLILTALIMASVSHWFLSRTDSHD